jgi:hypothetical protein
VPQKGSVLSIPCSSLSVLSTQFDKISTKPTNLDVQVAGMRRVRAS